MSYCRVCQIVDFIHLLCNYVNNGFSEFGIIEDVGMKWCGIIRFSLYCMTQFCVSIHSSLFLCISELSSLLQPPSSDSFLYWYVGCPLAQGIVC